MFEAHRPIRGRRCPAVVAAVAAVLAVFPSGADPTERGRRMPPAERDADGLRVQRHATLASIRPNELFRGPLVGSVSVDDLLRDIPSASAILTRELPALWELRVPADLPLEMLDVRFDLVADNGERRRLNGPEAGRDIPVRTRPLPPVVVREEGSFVVLRGGAVFELDLGSVRRSGNYGGRLTVRVETPEVRP